MPDLDRAARDLLVKGSQSPSETKEYGQYMLDASDAVPGLVAHVNRLEKAPTQADAMTGQEGKLWKNLANALDKLLVCYRVGSQPGKLLDVIRGLREQLAVINKEVQPCKKFQVPTPPGATGRE